VQNYTNKLIPARVRTKLEAFLHKIRSRIANFDSRIDNLIKF